jgi:DNA topoisomerase-3
VLLVFKVRSPPVSTTKMSKSLIIAEKPSVANDIARVLGKLKKEKDFFENEQ